ncbi:MAG: hypothetical protein IT424_02675 [Pirellulales bacterium]|nr:hypothetical protein [Pirellulales bacterium]
MMIEGYIHNGQIVFDPPLALPDGAKVTVSVEPAPNAAAAEGQFPTLYERLKSVVGKIDGLPGDFAINHDHYIHGQPKRQ